MTLLLLTLLQVKHFIVDFPLQTPWMYLNKGTWGHPGGLVHAGLHGAMTILIVACFAHWTVALWLGCLEALAHYMIDFAKVRIVKAYDLDMKRDEEFWVLLGFDQLLHQLCYVAIIWTVLA